MPRNRTRTDGRKQGKGVESDHEQSYFIAEETLIEDLRRVARKLGRVPSGKEYKEEGNHSYHTLQKRFGSYSDARAAAGLPDTPSKGGKRQRKLLYEACTASGGDA